MKIKLSDIFVGDRGIWIIIFLLSICSLLSVYSAAGQLAFVKSNGNTTYYLLKQGIMLLLSYSLIVMISHIPYKYFSKLSLYFYYISIFLLVFTLFFGLNVNDARRWILLPGGITFQTSDFAKIALLMYLSRVLSIKEAEINSYQSFFKIVCLPIFLTVGLILPANLSTAILLFVVSLVLLFFSNLKIKYIFTLVVLVGIFGVFFFLIVRANQDIGRFATWNARIENFISPPENKVENRQEKFSKVAIATGGIIGKGAGKSSQRNVLPHPYSDYIYAIIVEEFGLAGGVIILSLYLFLYSRSRLIIKKVKRKFGAYAVASLVSLIVIQAIANMAVATNLFPITGQPLPFVSYGGTSIVFIGIAFGIILSVSKEAIDVEQEKLKDLVTNSG